VTVFRQEFVAPRIGSAFKAAARGKLPLGFRRKRLSVPPRERLRITERDVNDRVVVEAVNGAARTMRLTPERVARVMPPVRDVATIHRTDWLHEHE